MFDYVDEVAFTNDQGARAQKLFAAVVLAAGLGLRARETVERHLTWPGYASEIRRLLSDAADRTKVSA